MTLPAATNQMMVIPRWLTAPDAWIAILLASYLQYKQYSRRRQQKGEGKVHAGAKNKPKRNAAWTLVHECLFTNLHMMVSPFSNQAASMNAEMVDLQNDEDVNSYARKVASGKMPKKKKAKSGSASDASGGKTMEVRSRRITRGEMVHDAYYPAVETTLNLALSMLVGLASRWLLGLIRSLRLSVFSSNQSLSGPGGPCCSPYRGGDDEGTRLPGSFERLLACVLIKQEGDNAGTVLFTFLLLALFMVVLKLSWSVSSPSVSRNDDLDDDADNEKERGNKNEADTPTYKRINPRRVKRFLVGVGASIFSLWLFHTPALLRVLGLDGIVEAAEEWGARFLLFGNLLGVLSLPKTDTLDEPSEIHQNLMNIFLLLLALTWGYIAAGMMTPIEETARNAAYILSPSTPSKKEKNPQEVLTLMNVRMMLGIQAMAPFMIMCTYLFSARFAETTKASSRGGQMSFSQQYLRNSGLFVRVALTWCFIAASSYTLRPLLQSYLDQATTVASAMATLGEDGSSGATAVRGARNKRTATPASSRPRADPFNDRYKAVVLTTGRFIAFPAFVMFMLAVAIIRGGDGSAHPGVGYESQPKDAPRSILPVKGLLPPYSNTYMSWVADQDKTNDAGLGPGDALLEVAALSQSTWEQTPFRDSAHKKVVDLLGRRKFCYPPPQRSVKALGRHVDFLLDSGSDDKDERSILTINALTGRELLDMAPNIPSLIDILFHRQLAEIPSVDDSCEVDNDNADEAGSDVEPKNIHGSTECKATDGGNPGSEYPTFTDMLSYLASHTFLTPTIVFPMVDTIAFLSSLWWNYWYSLTMVVYWIKLRKAAAFLSITS